MKLLSVHEEPRLQVIDLNQFAILPPEGQVWILGQVGEPFILVDDRVYILTRDNDGLHLRSFAAPATRIPAEGFFTHSPGRFQTHSDIVSRFNDLIVAWNRKSDLQRYHTPREGPSDRDTLASLVAGFSTTISAPVSTAQAIPIPQTSKIKPIPSPNDVRTVRKARREIAEIMFHIVTEQSGTNLFPYGHVIQEFRTYNGACVLVIKTANSVQLSQRGRLARGLTDFLTAANSIVATDTIEGARVKESGHSYQHFSFEKVALFTPASNILKAASNSPSREFADLGDEVFDLIDMSTLAGWDNKHYGHTQHTQPHVPYGDTYAVSLTYSVDHLNNNGYWDCAIFNRSR